MNALVIAAVNVRRLLRDRTSLFFVFVLPIVLIVVLGTMYGGRSAPRMGIVVVEDGPWRPSSSTRSATARVALELKEPATVDELRSRVEDGHARDRGRRAGRLRRGAPRRRHGQVTVLGQPATSAISALQEAVATAIAEQAAAGRRGPRRRGSRAACPFEEALAIARRDPGARRAGVTVVVERIGEGLFPAGTGAFQPGAQSQLVLFMFLTSMTAATQLILTRQLGVSRRMVASPVGVSTILVGETLGRFGVAMLQGAFIVLLSAALFGVGWGDPVAATTVVVLFALVGTGAAMVVGVFANNPDQAGVARDHGRDAPRRPRRGDGPARALPRADALARLPHAAGVGRAGAPRGRAARWYGGRRDRGAGGADALRDGPARDRRVGIPAEPDAMSDEPDGAGCRRPRGGRGPCPGIGGAALPAGAPPPSSIVELETVRVATVRSIVDADDVPAFMADALGMVVLALHDAGVAPAGPPFARYFSMSPDGLDVADRLPGRRAVPRGRVVHPGELPAGPAAVTTHVGPFDGLEAAWTAFRAAIDALGRRRADDPWEVYVVGPRQRRRRGGLAHGAHLAARTRRVGRPAPRTGLRSPDGTAATSA